MAFQDRLIRGIRIRWDVVDEDCYVREIPSLSSLRELEFESNVTFFTGENGTGKSTLLEAFAVAAGFNPEGGSRNYNFSTRNTHSSLHRAITVIKGVRRPRHSYFLRLRASTMLLPRWRSTGTGMTLPCTMSATEEGPSMNSPTAKAFWPDAEYV